MIEDENKSREVFHAERASGIGGSDAAAILGLDPYKGPLDVWQDKKGIERERKPSEYAWWGLALESLIRQRYQQETGQKVVIPPLLRHPDHPELIAHPDGIIAETQRGLEVKTAGVNMAKEWGEPGTDEIPTPYVVQCAHYMMVTGLRRWDVAVLIGGNDFRVYRLVADQELEAFLLEKLAAWWKTHVVEGVEPAVDDSASSKNYIHRKYPRESQPLALAPPEALSVALQLREAREALEKYGAQKALAENRLKAMIAHRAGFEGPDWSATWKKAKGRTGVDWERVARAMAVDNEQLFNQLVGANTREGPGVRRFVFRSTKED